MDIIQIVGLGLTATMLIVVVKGKSPQIAFLLSLLVGVFIFIFLLDKIQLVINLLEKLSVQAGVEMIFLQTILKIIGIAYIAEFAAQIAKDAGEGSIASKIELAGKVLILVLALPIVQRVVETVLNLLPT
ncbi:stage III sporulation protein AD [Tumebacillus sp. ITR2]|jgi:stage III sporulation protein AD|uniref:Stage III sporulation protein AD n=1 Tax=Tumebacillus amylolyticus TaxID=2801339 RepID=A0ABS1JD19_9BACL|nr:stage III sporulation protein AD [Tumebacillus amylolyticus]MBL0388143.1 stage III sporulation protein AD [Tumebacillus amylolyticus]